MISKTCEKCGNTCDVIFRYSICVNGVMRYAKKGKPFPIPVCSCSEKKAA